MKKKSQNFAIQRTRKKREREREREREKVSKAQKGHSQCGPCGHGRYRESLAI